MKIIKTAVLISLIWCSVMVLLNTVLLLLKVFEPGGYTPWVNPIGIFIITFPFFFLAAILNIFLKNKLNLNKWISASISVVIIYLTSISYRLLENDYFRTLDWKVSVFLIVQTAMLVWFDYLVGKWLSKKNKSI